MARHIKADGTVTLALPKNGTEFSLDEMRSFVGGHLEAIKLTSQEVLYCNEDFVGLQLPINQVATDIMHQHRTDIIYPLCGDVLIASLRETGDDDKVLHVQTVPTQAACTECGNSPSLEWSLYGMTGILCRNCLAKEVDNVNNTLDIEW